MPQDKLFESLLPLVGELIVASKPWSENVIKHFELEEYEARFVSNVPDVATKIFKRLGGDPSSLPPSEEVTKLGLVVSQLDKKIAVVADGLSEQEDEINQDNKQLLSGIHLWVQSLRDLSYDVSKATQRYIEEETTKNNPSGGVHAHIIEPGAERTESDGGHSHVVEINGTEHITDKGGEHSHPLPKDRRDIEESGPHKHTIHIGHNAVTMAQDGEHTHELGGEGTTYGGIHQHFFEFNGKNYETRLPSTIIKDRMNPDICFYHGDIDGMCSAAIYYRLKKEEVDLHKIDYGDKFPWEKIEGRKTVLMVDFALQPFSEMVKLKEVCAKQGTKLIWIDHHQEALKEAKKAKFSCEGVTQQGKAGCELTWRYFKQDEKEPEVVHYAGRFDVWDHYKPEIMLVHYAMESMDLEPSVEAWDELFKKSGSDWEPEIRAGEQIKTFLDKMHEESMKGLAFPIKFEGLSCIVGNYPLKGSMSFDSVSDGYDAIVKFHWSNKGFWDLGMYALKDSVDVGVVCSKYGGGGHREAGGFQAKEFPFELPLKKVLKIVEKIPIKEINPRLLAGMDQPELLSLNRRVHQLYGAHFKGNDKRSANSMSREDLINASLFIFEEMESRDIEVDQETELYDEVSDLVRRTTGKTAEVNPSGEGDLPSLKFDDVAVRCSERIVLRSPFVSLVGSICNKGQTQNDVDILVHGPLDEATRHVVHFRLGRMLPSEINQRLQFHGSELGGPFTNHAHLYDLVLVPRRDRRSIIEMAELKADDPFMDWPKESGQRRAVVQVHVIGKGAHFDLRFKVDGHLVGWTLFAGVRGKVSDVNTVAQARDLYVGYTTEDGNKYLKPVLAPKRLGCTPKSRQPVVWLGINGRVFDPGEVGAGTEEQGVIVAVARPKVEWGMQSQWFHEYFITGDKQWQGQLFLRQVVGWGGTPDEEEAGRVTPEGETFWQAHISKEALPNVLKTRTVRKGEMPPPGKSAMPVSLERVTPKEFRFWEAGTEKEAKEIRDALVKERFFTKDNVALVDGQFRRLVKKSWIFLPDEVEKGYSRSFIGSPGGKSSVAKELVAVLPEHKTYVEPFCGSAVVMFTKERSEVEVINDVNSDLTRAFRAIKTLTKSEIEELKGKNWEGSKALFDKLLRSDASGKVDWLHKFIYTQRHSYRYDGKSWNPSHRGAKSVPSRIDEFHDRLKGVRVYNTHYKEIVEKYDGKDTVFFFDPPYAGHDVSIGEKKFDEEEFFKVLVNLKGKFLLTYGERGELPKMLKDHGFHYSTFGTNRNLSNARGASDDKVLKQILVSNYEIDKQVRQFGVTKVEKVRFTLSWLYWRGQTVVREGPSRQVWLLMLDDPDKKGLFGWELQHNPLAGDDPVSGLERGWKGEALLTADQELSPGESIEGNILNDTKNTPAWVRIKDSGEATILERGDEFVKLDFDGEKLKGKFTVTAEEPGSKLWVLEGAKKQVTEDPSKPLPSETKKNVPIFKTKEERFVLGIVLEPNDGEDGADFDPDYQMDVYSAEEIRQAAHKYLAMYRNNSLMHEELLDSGDVQIVECSIAPVDYWIDTHGNTWHTKPKGGAYRSGDGPQLVKKDTWLLGLKIINDDLWTDVKEGRLNGLSIGGSAQRVLLEAA